MLQILILFRLEVLEMQLKFSNRILLLLVIVVEKVVLMDLVVMIQLLLFKDSKKLTIFLSMVRLELQLNLRSMKLLIKNMQTGLDHVQQMVL